MPLYQVSARTRCASAPDRVWPLLTDLERWESSSPVPLQLEVLESVEPVRLTYRVVGGLPVKDHRATVELVPVDGGTDIRWSHEFRARIPGTGGFLRGRLESQAARAASQLAAAASVA